MIIWYNYKPSTFWPWRVEYGCSWAQSPLEYTAYLQDFLDAEKPMHLRTLDTWQEALWTASDTPKSCCFT